MRPRLLLLAAVAVPSLTAAIVGAHGCSNEQPFESACLWMADPDNCYREFYEDMQAWANVNPTENPTGFCKPPGNPTEANQGGSMTGTENGAFSKRDKLDACVLDHGGSVVIDPPLDLTMWPPDPFADPVTYTIKFMAPDGNACGQATYTSPHGFSFTVNPPPDAGSTVGAGGAPTTTTTNTLATDPTDVDAAGGAARHAYGTFSSVIAPGRDAFDVTCPSGETHHFNLNEVAGTSGNPSSCPGLANMLPSASFQVYPGGVNTTGAISFAIVFPPLTGSYPDASPSTPPTANPPVVFFNCSIPGGNAQCQNGVLDGSETDVDCGGPVVAAGDAGTCPARCADGLKCIQDGDCLPMHKCQTDPMSGARTCGCIPLTACPAGSDCGEMPDGCGGTVMCGTAMCTGGTMCGGGGVPNKCGCCGPGCIICPAPDTCDTATNKCVCKPLTACAAGLDCGTVANGCGSNVICGPTVCANPLQTCGGGGTPNKCGCTPKTMCPTGQDCGTAPDGCGGMIDCGTCSAPQTCGGSGTPGTCGCCGLAGCGTCTAPQTCGGSGTPNKCGCTTPLTKCPAGLDCGTVPDTCGGTITCGTCTGTNTCGGGGTANKCGCTPQVTSCPSGADCGTVPNGCGGVIHCGPAACADPMQTCGGGGTPNVCGACMPSMTCTNGHNCGMGPDGCGNMISCGTCPSFQTCGGGGTPGFCG